MLDLKVDRKSLVILLGGGVVGDMGEHWLNGKKVVSATMGSAEWKALIPKSMWKDHPQFGTFRKGHIGLQDHGDGISFRNIKLRKL